MSDQSKPEVAMEKAADAAASNLLSQDQNQPEVGLESDAEEFVRPKKIIRLFGVDIECGKSEDDSTAGDRKQDQQPELEGLADSPDENPTVDQEGRSTLLEKKIRLEAVSSAVDSSNNNDEDDDGNPSSSNGDADSSGDDSSTEDSSDSSSD